MDASNSGFAGRRVLLAAILAASVLASAGCARTPVRTTQPYAPPSNIIIPLDSPGFYHTLTKGETLYHIAKVYDADLNEIMRANHIQNPSTLEVGQRIFIPRRSAPVYPPAAGPSPVSLEDAHRIIGRKKTSYAWQTITVHHSGTLQGSASNFDRDHRRRNMGGLFYHFVIGNGTRTKKGEVEVGFRWDRQIKANRPFDIQICLVGNFDKQEVSPEQFNTLVNLIRALREDYGISKSNVRQHCDVRGKRTDCPGKKFPFSRLLASI